jgi:Cft2 family RNA processing exonuclease
MKKSIKISSTEDGLFLDDFILSFDSCRSKHISFLSSASNPFLEITARIFATEETLQLFKVFNKTPNALVCQYNRAFSIGKLKMDLLPSGGVLGGASLFVETEGASLLYAPLLRVKGVQTLRSMQLKSAGTLLINALHPINLTTKVKRKNEIERLLSSVEKNIKTDQWPVIFCPPVGLAQELSFLFSERNIPFSVHPMIHKVHKIYESFGSHVGEYSILRPNKKQESVLLLPQLRSWRGFRKHPHQRGPSYLVQKDFLHFAEPLRGIDDTFYLNLHADIEDIRQTVIPEVDPKRLVLYGPYSKGYAEDLKGQVPLIQVLFQNNQPALF